VTLHSLRHATLTGSQAGQLFSVAEAGLDVPATALALQQNLPARVEIIAGDVVQSSVTVCGYDESDDAVSREMHGADPGPRAARDAVAGKLLGPLLDRLGAAVAGDPSIALKGADPNDVLLIQPLRERPGIVPEVERQVLKGRPARNTLEIMACASSSLVRYAGRSWRFERQSGSSGNAQRLVAPKQTRQCGTQRHGRAGCASTPTPPRAAVWRRVSPPRRRPGTDTPTPAGVAPIGPG
jgi:hypothetical protein